MHILARKDTGSLEIPPKFIIHQGQRKNMLIKALLDKFNLVCFEFRRSSLVFVLIQSESSKDVDLRPYYMWH